MVSMHTRNASTGALVMQESNSELLFLEYAMKFIGALGDALGQPQC